MGDVLYLQAHSYIVYVPPDATDADAKAAVHQRRGEMIQAHKEALRAWHMAETRSRKKLAEWRVMREEYERGDGGNAILQTQHRQYPNQLNYPNSPKIGHVRAVRQEGPPADDRLDIGDTDEWHPEMQSQPAALKL